jgi:predicted nucleic acid-binding protein
MRPVVLDTDVVSFLFKSDSRSQLYLPHLRDRQWLISFMTEAELEQWALLANWQAKRIDWLRIFLGRFAIIPSSRDLVLKWAEVMVAARRLGRRVETADAWIASTAIVYDAPLITHNGSDYSVVPGLKVITEMSQ